MRLKHMATAAAIAASVGMAGLSIAAVPAYADPPCNQPNCQGGPGPHGPSGPPQQGPSGPPQQHEPSGPPQQGPSGPPPNNAPDNGQRDFNGNGQQQQGPQQQGPQQQGPQQQGPQQQNQGGPRDTR